MKTKLLLLLLLWAGVVWGQEQKSFKERNVVDLNSYGVVYVSKGKDAEVFKGIKIKNIVYRAKKDTLSFEKDSIKIANEKKFKDLSPNDTGLNSNTVTANLKVDNGKIRIYPWIFKNDKPNQFFKDNNVYIKMEDRKNYSFCYSSWQLGIVTLPIKWYVDSKLGNVETSINAMVNAGYKWGTSKFIKFPHEEKAREYKSAYSFNVLAGISKIELNKVNTSKMEIPIEEANIAAISIGASLGFHYADFTLMPTIGIDIPTTNRKNWNFTNIPWIGIGLGYNFLKFN